METAPLSPSSAIPEPLSSSCWDILAALKSLMASKKREAQNRINAITWHIRDMDSAIETRVRTLERIQCDSAFPAALACCCAQAGNRETI
jgi:hypothetical protein